MGGKIGIFGLRRKGLRPIQGKVEMAVAVVGLADLGAGRPVVVQNPLRRCIDGLAQNAGLLVALGVGQKLKAFPQRAEFAKRIPTQVVFFHQLLHMLWCRTARAGFKHAAAVHQFHDRQHLGGGAQFQDREQVGQIVAQHVARHGDRVFALADRFQRQTCCLPWVKDLEFVRRPCGGKDRLYVFDQLGVMRAGLIQPEHRLTAFGLLPVDRQFDPILDRGLPGGGRAPDVALFHLVFVEDVAVCQNQTDSAVGRDFKRGRVRSVLFGLLRHQTDVLHRASRGRIQRAGFLEIGNRLVVDAGVGTVGDHAVGVGGLAVRAPAFSPGADQRGQGGIDDHVGRHMQVGDALFRVDHIQRRAGVDHGLDISLNRLELGHLGHAVQQRAKARVGVDPCGTQRVAVGVEHRFQELVDGMAEDDRV